MILSASMEAHLEPCRMVAIRYSLDSMASTSLPESEAEDRPMHVFHLESGEGRRLKAGREYRKPRAKAGSAFQDVFGRLFVKKNPR